ncbi:MAG: class I SAM-dependent methyltransferase [Planctomycetota bacterium]
MSEADSMVVSRINPDGRMEIAWSNDPPGRGFCVDFRRVSLRGVAKLALVRACGGRGTIVDATAGLGGDAWLLAAAGSDVLAIERSPIVLSILADGLQRARDDATMSAVASRIELHGGNATELLPMRRGEWSAIYLDPMYPAKRGSALAQKSIRLVRAAVGDDADADALLLAAAATGTRRIVVKRPHGAPSLLCPPDAKIESKLVRYDIYAGAGRGLRALRERAV